MRYVTFLAIFIAITFTGCGGGGPGSPAVSSNNPLPSNGPAINQTFGTLHLTAPANTLPSDAKITVLPSAPTALPPNSNFLTVGDNAAISVNLGGIPANPITISFVDKTRRAGLYTYLLTTLVDGKWKIINAVQHTVAEELKFVVAPDWFIGGKITAVIGKNLVTPPSIYTGRILLASDPNGRTGKKICLNHGFNSTVDMMRPLAAEIIKHQNVSGNHFYSEVWGFDYDYTESGTVTAAGFDKVLDQFHSEGANIDIVAHSWGAPVSRYSLENDGKTEAVHTLFSVCGANLGSIWANADTTLRGLQEDYLNATGKSLPAGILAFDSPVLQDLIPGSQFLSSINNSGLVHRGIVNYHIISTWDDKVVGPASGSANGIKLLERTAGFVEYRPISAYGYGHSGLLQISNGLDLLASEILRQDAISPISINFDPSPCDASGYGWYPTETVRNDSSSVVQLTDQSFQLYGADGSMIGAEWYDPNIANNVLFPEYDHYFGWYRSLSPGETVVINLFTRFNDPDNPMPIVPVNFRSQSFLAMVRGLNGNGLPFFASGRVTLHNGDNWPSEPNDRSRRGGARSHSTVSLRPLRK